jgi:N-acetylmuramoyl-L-alanine amidase
LRNVCRLLINILFCIVFVASAESADSIKVTGARIGGDGQRARFVLDLDRKVPVEINQSTGWNRARILLPKTNFQLQAGAGAEGRGLIRSFQYGANDAGMGQVIIDFSAPAKVAATEFIDRKRGRPARLVIDFQKLPQEAFAETPQPPRETAGETNAPPVLPASLPKYTVVIDPGHGGTDPGAVSRNKTREKDVVLAFARALRQELLKSPGFNVVMTRETDQIVSLPGRVKIARDARASLFIAVHADIIRGKTTRGTTLYTLSEKASDAEAEIFANKENRADAVIGLELPPETNAVADVLYDLVQRETNSTARLFADRAVARIAGVTEVTGKPVRSAGFVVLKAPDVPSVLVELGYLSNPDDERLLTDQSWRQRTARALAQAIVGHFESGQLTTGSTGSAASPLP